MAIDTEAKRSSAILHRRMPMPDGSVDAIDRWALAGVYLVAPAVVPLFRPGPIAAGTLGCPDTRVYIMNFCGDGIKCDVTDQVSFLKYDRQLDDDSEAEFSIHMPGDASGAACCECVGEIRTWRHELMVVRGDEVVWGPGPLVTITVQREIAHFVARDIVAWLDVRVVHNDYDFHQVDLATIARDVVEDALTMGDAAQIDYDDRDACILAFATFQQTGKKADLKITANQQTAGEILRSLAGQGLDFTVVNRSLYVGADFAFGPIGPLRDEDFVGDLEVTEHGLAAGTKQYVSGGASLTGTAGGVDPYFGLIERAVEGQAASETQADLDRIAAERVAGTNPPPVTVNVPSDSALAPTAPVVPAALVPGSLVDLDIQDMCRPALVRQRLTAVEFRLDENGEQVAITVAPVGGAQLALETA